MIGAWYGVSGADLSAMAQLCPPAGQEEIQFNERRRPAVSIHGHTLHSRESLDLLFRLAPRWPAIRLVMRRIESDCRAAQGQNIDFTRAWQAPPIAPHDASRLETAEIRALGQRPLVSLTDHDDLEAPLCLRVLEECRKLPVSVEWTLPFEGRS